MNYQQALKESMESLAQLPEARFFGYNVAYGGQMYNTLKDIPKEKLMEMPLAENVMSGIAVGMGLEGFRPVLIFERHDFMLNALDTLVNHLDKLKELSHGEYNSPVIIRATVGGTKPLHPGPQHIQDYTEAFKHMFRSIPIYDLKTPQEVRQVYAHVKTMNEPVMVVEKRDLYSLEEVQ